MLALLTSKQKRLVKMHDKTPEESQSRQPPLHPNQCLVHYKDKSVIVWGSFVDDPKILDTVIALTGEEKDFCKALLSVPDCPIFLPSAGQVRLYPEDATAVPDLCTWFVSVGLV